MSKDVFDSSAYKLKHRYKQSSHREVIVIKTNACNHIFNRKKKRQTEVEKIVKGRLFLDV